MANNNYDEAREALKKQLTVIHGGGQSPVVRLGLRDRVPMLSKRQIIWMFSTKFLLLASVLYFLYG